MNKDIANEALGIFERYKEGKCSRDKALEDVANLFEKKANERPIIGYVKGTTLRTVLDQILRNRVLCTEKWVNSYNCIIHKNDMDDIEQMRKHL